MVVFAAIATATIAATVAAHPRAVCYSLSVTQAVMQLHPHSATLQAAMAMHREQPNSRRWPRHCIFLPPIFLALHFLQARLVLAAVFAARLDPHYLSHFLWP